MRLLLGWTVAAVLAIQGLAGTEAVRSWQAEQAQNQVCSLALVAGDEARLDACEAVR
jgi:hypothetical protein